MDQVARHGRFPTSVSGSTVVAGLFSEHPWIIAGIAHREACVKLRGRVADCSRLAHCVAPEAGGRRSSWSDDAPTISILSVALSDFPKRRRRVEATVELVNLLDHSVSRPYRGRH
jgi:hypothetical protein